MAAKTIVFMLSFIAAGSTTKVNMTSRWAPDFGWDIVCSWTLFANDTLQSVRLTDHYRQFSVFRPETDRGPKDERHESPASTLTVRYSESSQTTGACLMKLELHEPREEDLVYGCEVSGERPMFRIDRADIQIPVLVPPSDATLYVTQRYASETKVLLNCTSRGLPAPILQWSVGEQREPNDFSGNAWNKTSKLWEVYSLFSYTPDGTPAKCTPKSTKNGQTLAGESAVYSGNSKTRETTSVLLGVLSFLALSRQ